MPVKFMQIGCELQIFFPFLLAKCMLCYCHACPPRHGALPDVARCLLRAKAAIIRRIAGRLSKANDRLVGSVPYWRNGFQNDNCFALDGNRHGFELGKLGRCHSCW